MDAWQREIIELHEFFEGLFVGQVQSLDRAEQALHEAFTMVGPTGTRTDRSQVLAQLEAGINHADDLRIGIEQPALIAATDSLVVAEYIEVHERSGVRSGDRRSTVVFRVDPAGPNGLRWLRVHETFID